MSTIGFDARCLRTPHLRGIGRYLYNIVDRLTTRVGTRWLAYSQENEETIFIPERHNVVSRPFSFRGDRLQLWEQLGLPIRAALDKNDILFCGLGTLPLMQPCKTILTLHDTLAFEEHDDTIGERTYWDHIIPAAIHRAAHVITISEASKEAILKRWPSVENRITAIPHGIDKCFLSSESYAPTEKSWINEISDTRYFVYLGGPLKRKRFDWAANIFNQVNNDNIILVACGFNQNAARDAAKTLPESIKSKVLFAPFLSDVELSQLYKNSLGVLYPTLFEGFGFPAIEAQASGVPVFMSSVGSLSELNGPLTIFLKTHDQASWVNALNHRISQTLIEKSLILDAKRWVAGYSWEQSAEKHLDVFLSVLSAR